MANIAGTQSVLQGLQAEKASPAKQRHDTQIKKVARQFEAMFMTEMIKCARPSNQAAGAFAGGKSEESWKMFMDQALGQAATTGKGAGDGSLRRAIEKSLLQADAHTALGQIK